MRAARQGSFDGFCGVYALVNALELLGVTGRRSAIHSDLFNQLAHALGAAALLSAMHDGLEAHELERAAEFAFHWLAMTHGIELEVSRPLQGRKFHAVGTYLKALKELAGQPDTTVIISFKRPFISHWSVIKKIEGEVIFLRDSAGLTALEAAEFLIDKGAHHFRPADTLLITRQS